MKNAFVLGILIFCFLVSCEAPNDQLKKQPREATRMESIIHQIGEGNLKVLEIEGCEYFVFKDHQKANQGFGFMAHKGNCKNPIHCHNQPKNETMGQESTTDD